MDGQDVTNARIRLGKMWNISRPLSPAELARVLGLSSKNGSDHVNKMEKGKSNVSGTIEMLLRLYLAGAVPPDDVEIFKTSPTTETAPVRGRVSENRRLVTELPEGVVSAREAAEILGMTQASLATRRSSGQGPEFLKLVTSNNAISSDRVYYERAELERFLAERQTRKR